MVSCGVGTDSVYLLTWLRDHGIRPDAILTADTGSEKKRFYEYIPYLEEWIASQPGWPSLTIVKNPSKKYNSLGENCHVNRTLPSLAYGKKGCSQKWKVEIMDTWTNSWEPAVVAWHRGLKVVKLIGYDASPADCKRSKIREDDKYIYIYPLRDNGIKRPDCIAGIEAAGLPQPGKSACYFCPAAKCHEIPELFESEPHKLADALVIEANGVYRTLQEKPGISTTLGLGRRWSWREFLRRTHPEILQRLREEYNIADDVAMLIDEEYRIRAKADPKAEKILKSRMAELERKVEKYLAGEREEVGATGF